MSIAHGKVGNYRSGRQCRCAACTRANRDYQRKYTRFRAAREIPPDVEHGLKQTYTNWMCRCWKCKTANTVWCNIYKWQRRQKDAA